MGQRDTQPSNLPFDPPYSLKGQVSLNFCISTDAAYIADQAAFRGHDLRLLKLVSFVPVIFVSSHWEPHPEHPEPYDEVIVSCFALKALRIYSVPLFLHLNDNFHVTLGREHYHLPKILDPTLGIVVGPDRFTVTGDNIHVELKFLPFLLQLMLLPVSVFVALVVACGTNLVKLLGTSDKPFISARISLIPGLSLGRFLRPVAFNTGMAAKLRPVLCLFWKRTYTVIGTPKKT